MGKQTYIGKINCRLVAFYLGLVLSLFAAQAAWAAPLNVGDVIDGTFTDVNDEDTFEFNAKAGESYFFDTLGGLLRWDLTTPSGAAVFTNQAGDQGPLVFPETGEYSLQIRPFSATRLTYRVQVVLTQPTSSTPFAIGEVVDGEIATQGEVDEFTFSGTAGDPLYFDAIQRGGGQASWFLFDPDGDSLFPSVAWADQELVLPKTGTYTLRVDGNADDTPTYQFTVVVIPDVSSTAININDVINGDILVQGEVDEFTFNAQPGSRVYFDRQVGGLTFLDWALFDAGGAEIFNDFNGWRDKEPIELAGGDYTLRLDGNGDRVGAYQFQLHLVPDPISTPVEFYFGTGGEITVPGQTRDFTIDLEAGQAIGFDRLASTGVSAFLLRVYDPSGALAYSQNSIGSGATTVFNETGTYRIEFDGSGDRVGNFGFRLWPLTQPVPVPILLDTVVTGRITARGQRKQYEFAGTAGDTLFLDINLNDSPRAQFAVFAPDGSRLLSNRTGDSTINSLPETGTYLVEVVTTTTSIGTSGNYSFQLSNSITPAPFPDAAELVVSNVSAPGRLVGDPAQLVISWTVTNNGAVATNVSEWIDRVELRTDNEFSVAVFSPTNRADFVVIEDVAHSGVLAPGESYQGNLVIEYPLAGALAEAFDVVVTADAENQVFEATSDLNEGMPVQPVALFERERLVTGQGAITTNIVEGSLVPANVPVVLGGNANLGGGSVNVVFIMDASASTASPSGLDANGDGTVDDADDLNGDNRNGDVLDVEIGTVTRVINELNTRADDLLVTVIPFDQEAYNLDLGPPRHNQFFESPQAMRFDDELSDIEYALRNNMPRIFGTAFGPPVAQALQALQQGPASDQRLVFFLTDGAGQTATPEQLDALAALGIRFFAFQIGSPNITRQLQDVIDGIDAHPNATAIGQFVENPNDLPDIALQLLDLERVEVNAAPAQALDAQGNYFTQLTFAEGPNLVNIEAFDSDDNSVDKDLNVVGAPLDQLAQTDLVPSQAMVQFRNTQFNRATNRLLADARLVNNSALPVVGPIQVTLETMPVAVTLQNADSVTPEGIGVVVYDAELGGGLNTGELSDPRPVHFGNTRRDRFSVHPGLLSAGNSAPFFASVPVVSVNQGDAYGYDAEANDADGDAISYSLALAPTGMSVDGETGQISWTPDVGQAGTHLVQVQAADGRGGSATQQFQLSVITGVADLPPVITSLPVELVLQDEPYNYPVLAFDPEGTQLTYLLDSAPAGMSIDATSGVLSAAPGALATGLHPVAIRVVDAAGLQASQQWQLNVKGANQPPMFVSTPVLQVAVGETYRYRAVAQDDDPVLIYALTSAPAGMTIGATSGAITLTPQLSQLGGQLVNVTVTDPFGEQDVQSYVLDITEDLEPPQVAVVPERNTIMLGESVNVTVQAVDNVGIASLSLDLDGQDQVLNGDTALVTPAVAGLLTLNGSATDTDGLSASDAVSLRVIDASDTTPPTVAIETPATQTIVSYLTDVVGSVTADDLLKYELDFARVDQVDLADITADNGQWRNIGSGTEEVASDVVGIFDGTAVANDEYVVRLMAEDNAGNIAAAAILLSVTGEAKIGQYRVEFTDLSIPIANIPIEIKRIYETTQADRDGELGYGWRMQLADPDIRETVPVGANEELLGLFAVEPFIAETRVYLNAPDGKRIGFTFRPEPTQSLFGTAFIPAFEPDPGVYYELEVDPVTLTQRSDGSFSMFLLGFNYNPEDFRLVEPSGLTWHYNQFDGIDRVTDRSGAELDFREDGIFHSSGVSVTFERDADGRITRITDPEGNAMSYAYDEQGDLIAFSNRNGEVESFGYFEAPAHYLNTITDANGNVANTLFYDDDGRLSQIFNGVGEVIEQDWSPETFTGTITDAKGQITQLVYDLRGNVLSETDPAGGVTLFTYDGDDNVLTETDANGNTTSFTYDENGEVLTEVDGEGGVTTYTYDLFGNRTSVTNANGLTTTNSYNDRGNLESVALPGGLTMQIEYDAAGRVLRITDFNGNATEYGYNGNISVPVEITQPDGTRRTFTRDAAGRVIAVTDEAGNTTTLVLDAEGRVVQGTDAEGNSFTQVYEGDLLVEETDSVGNTRRYEYDAAGQRIRTIQASGDVVQFAYDANGNRTSVTDPLGNVTTFTFDNLDRLVARTDAAGQSDTFVYDAAGNLISITDRRGLKRTFAYDGANRAILETWFDAADNQVRQIATTYDGAGNATQIDDGNSVLSSVYDGLNRLISQTTAIAGLPDRTVQFVYDGNDNLVEVSDADATQTQTFNSRDLMTAINLSEAGTDVGIDLTYDVRGLRDTLVRGLDAVEVGSSQYGYDRRTLVTDVDHSVAGFNTSFDYAYDAIGRQVLQQHRGEQIDYVYDSIDQLIMADRSVQPDETYSYDANGNPAGPGIVVGAANRPLVVGALIYTYDNAGNLVRRTDSNTGEYVVFEYDHRNRLQSLERRDAADVLQSSESYIYDGLDRRVGRNQDGAVSYTSYAGNDAWADLNADGSVARRYVNGPASDEKLARVDGGDVDWYVNDRQRTVADIVDSNGAVQNQLTYDSFGQVIAETNAADADRFAYTGRELAREFNVYDYRRRTYDPALGRFTTEDPLGFEANDANLYRYIYNIPAYATDPTGEGPALEYATMICNIAVPIWGYARTIANCLDDLYTGIAEAVQTATSNNGLAGAFVGCVAVGTIMNAAGGAAGAIPLPGAAAGAGGGGAYNSGKDGDGTGAAVALACGAVGSAPGG